MMAEGSQIDWVNHCNDFEDALEQTLAFDSTVRKARDYAQSDGSTLAAAIADHKTGGMALIGGARDASTLFAAWTIERPRAATMPFYACGPGAPHLFTFADQA